MPDGIMAVNTTACTGKISYGGN